MQREIIKKVSMLELSILYTVCLFMCVDIPTMYHPNILNSFGVIEHTQKFVENAKGNNKESKQTRVMSLVVSSP